MSFWTTVAKIGAGVAAPFTGGASLAAIPAIDAAGNILGSMAKSGQEANAKKDDNRILQEREQLERDKFGLAAPTTRMRQTAQASILKNASPTTAEWGGPGSGLSGKIVNFGGGASQALSHLAEDSAPLAKQVMAKNLADQTANRDSQSPYINDIGKSSLFDKAIGLASTGVNVYSGLSHANDGQPEKAPGYGPMAGGYRLPQVPSSIVMDDPRTGGITGNLPMPEATDEASLYPVSPKPFSNVRF